MFRQVRRLQSYARLAASLQHSPSHTEHRIALWKSILNARGFKPTFAEWWHDLDRNVGEPLNLPLVAPGSAMACRVFSGWSLRLGKLRMSLSNKLVGLLL